MQKNFWCHKCRLPICSLHALYRLQVQTAPCRRCQTVKLQTPFFKTKQHPVQQHSYPSKPSKEMYTLPHSQKNMVLTQKNILQKFKLHHPPPPPLIAQVSQIAQVSHQIYPCQYARGGHSTTDASIYFRQCMKQQVQGMVVFFAYY